VHDYERTEVRKDLVGYHDWSAWVGELCCIRIVSSWRSGGRGVAETATLSAKVTSLATSHVGQTGARVVRLSLGYICVEKRRRTQCVWSLIGFSECNL
jgi:hypothetical protein